VRRFAECDDPPIFQTNLFFGVKRLQDPEQSDDPPTFQKKNVSRLKRGRIQNKARTSKRGLKRPMEPPKT